MLQPLIGLISDFREQRIAAEVTDLVDGGSAKEDGSIRCLAGVGFGFLAKQEATSNKCLTSSNKKLLYYIGTNRL